MIIKCGADNVGNEDRQTDKRTHLMIIRHFPTMACKKMRKVYEIDDSRPQDLYIMEHELLQFFELDLGRQNY